MLIEILFRFGSWLILIHVLLLWFVKPWKEELWVIPFSISLATQRKDDSYNPFPWHCHSESPVLLFWLYISPLIYFLKMEQAAVVFCDKYTDFFAQNTKWVHVEITYNKTFWSIRTWFCLAPWHFYDITSFNINVLSCCCHVINTLINHSKYLPHPSKLHF